MENIDTIYAYLIQHAELVEEHSKDLYNLLMIGREYPDHIDQIKQKILLDHQATIAILYRELMPERTKAHLTQYLYDQIFNLDTTSRSIRVNDQVSEINTGWEWVYYIQKHEIVSLSPRAQEMIRSVDVLSATYELAVSQDDKVRVCVRFSDAINVQSFHISWIIGSLEQQKLTISDWGQRYLNTIIDPHQSYEEQLLPK